jgi:hypothetical protein
MQPVGDGPLSPHRILEVEQRLKPASAAGVGNQERNTLTTVGLALFGPHLETSIELDVEIVCGVWGRGVGLRL